MYLFLVVYITTLSDLDFIASSDRVTGGEFERIWKEVAMA
jgi:hypothetical protein